MLFLAVLESVDFVHPDGNIVFRTCEKEHGKVVFQMVSKTVYRQSSYI